MLEKAEELSSLASPQIAGSYSLSKINANQNPEILVFSHEVGGGVPAVMTSLWKFTFEI